ncbi:cutinase family protein [Gordonia sp. CPCC 205515]|uniref:cutinase family protein n=1 Tax=Gordonia sp. CPCC 205515 TaxID=3140791 RepID=UPI003AF33CFA
MRLCRPAYALLAATVPLVLTAASLTAAPAAAEDRPTCPAVHVLAVQGTSQSSSDAPTKTDTGFLSTVIRPVLGAKAADQSLLVERTYIPYRANFGDSGTTSTYRDSAGEGLNRLSQVASRVITQCPTTKLVPIGYSQGGHVVDAFAAAVADGQAPVAPDHIAFAVTFGSPTRGESDPLFPPNPGQVAPTDLPEIGDLKPTKFADNLPTPDGRGIGPEADEIRDFGSLSGRVARFCIPGDLACASPKSASLLRLGASVVEQSNLDFANDPTGTAARLASAVADTAVRGTAKIINSDITGTSLADLDVNPRLSISERLAEVSAPETLTPSSSSAADPDNTNSEGGASAVAAGSGDDNPLRAIARLGSIALNTVETFAAAMFTPENITSMITAGVNALATGAGAASGNPAAALTGASTAASGAQLGTAAANAAFQAVPPATAITAVRSLFQTLLNEVENNADLPQVVMDARTWNQVAYHSGYDRRPVSTTGATAAAVTADWIITAARAYQQAAADAAAESDTSPSTTRTAPKPGTTEPTAPYRTSDDNRTAPVGAIERNTDPARRGDHTLLAKYKPANASRDLPPAASGAASEDPPVIPVALENPSLTEAQRMEVATDPRFVRPNPAQRLARHGTIALPNQNVTAVPV